MNLLKIATGSNILHEEESVYQPEYVGCNHGREKDVALIRLSRDIAYSDKVQPIKLPTEDFLPNETYVFLSGWGKTKVGVTVVLNCYSYYCVKHLKVY